MHGASLISSSEDAPITIKSVGCPPY
jgi:hypothetical protein